MHTILKFSLSILLLSVSTLFAFHFANPSRPITSDGFVHTPATLNLLPPDDIHAPLPNLKRRKTKNSASKKKNLFILQKRHTAIVDDESAQSFDNTVYQNAKKKNLKETIDLKEM